MGWLGHTIHGLLPVEGQGEAADGGPPAFAGACFARDDGGDDTPHPSYGPTPAPAASSASSAGVRPVTTARTR
jgi:hypothetical protein